VRSPTSRARFATQWLLLGVLLAPFPLSSQQGQVGSPTAIGADHLFTRIAAGAISRSGRIALSQPQDRHVLIFDRARPAKPIGVAGRRGEGPGEFASPWRVGWHGTSLWVADRDRPRVEFFDEQGRHRASRVLTPPASGDRRHSYHSADGLLADSGVVYYPSLVSAAVTRARADERPEYPLILWRGSDGRLDTLALLRLEGNVIPLQGDLNNGRVAGYTSPPFSDRTFLRTGMDGRRTLLATIEPSAEWGEVRLRLFTERGASALDMRVVLPRTAISDRGWDSVLTSSAKFDGEGVWSTPAKAKESLAQLFVRPSHYPVISTALLGTDGTIWMRLLPERGDSVTWQAMTSSGTTIGRVTLPRRLRVLDGTGASVLGVLPDSDGVEQVLLYPIRWPR